MSMSNIGNDKARPVSNGLFKRGHQSSGSVARMSREIDQNSVDRARTSQLEDQLRRHERSNNSLQADLHVAQMQQSASDVVRRHLESQMRDMAAMVESSGQPGFSLDDARRRLAEENKRLQELLAQEAEARQRAEQARLKGTQALRELQSSITNSLDDRFSRIESNQSALNARNRMSMQESDGLRGTVVRFFLARPRLDIEAVTRTVGATTGQADDAERYVAIFAAADRR